MAVARIPLEGAKEKPLSFREEVALTVEGLGGAPLLTVSPLLFSGEITHLEGEYFLDSTLAYTGTLECSRCLGEYPFSEESEVRLRLHPHTRRPAARDARGGKPEEDLALEQGDLDVVYYDEPVLPIDEIVHEQVLIAQPMKPLCRPDCRGLCSICGKDCNSTDCSCEADRVDARLEVLKHLK